METVNSDLDSDPDPQHWVPYSFMQGLINYNSLIISGYMHGKILRGQMRLSMRQSPRYSRFKELSRSSNSFCVFEGPRFCIKNQKYWGIVDKGKTYQLTPLMSHLYSHWTVPLKCYFHKINFLLPQYLHLLSDICVGIPTFLFPEIFYFCKMPAFCHYRYPVIYKHFLAVHALYIGAF